MTTLNEAAGRIYQDFVTAWGATSPYTFDNEKYVPEEGTAWVRLTVVHGESGQESLGGTGLRKFDRPGIVFIQCFTPLDTGRAEADNLATLARNVFEGKHLFPEAIRFVAVSVNEIGAADGWHQVNVTAAFNYPETK